MEQPMKIGMGEAELKPLECMVFRSDDIHSSIHIGVVPRKSGDSVKLIVPIAVQLFSEFRINPLEWPARCAIYCESPGWSAQANNLKATTRKNSYSQVAEVTRFTLQSQASPLSTSAMANEVLNVEFQVKAWKIPKAQI